jgi:activating signal cointegrator complex subunit 3
MSEVSATQKCAQCQAQTASSGGSVDRSDGKFYCNACWDAFEQSRKGGQRKQQKPPQASPAVARSPATFGGAQSKGFYSNQAREESVPSVSKVDAPEIEALKRLLSNAPLDFSKPFDDLSTLESVSDSLRSREPSLVSKAMRPGVPIPTGQYSGHLSPRAANDGKYHALAFEESQGVGSAASALLMTAEDVVAQVYVHFDEDVTKIILNALDRLTSADTPNKYALLKDEVGNELVHSLGSMYFPLIQGIVENARDVFLRLLEEFCTLEDDDKTAPTETTFGTSVRFVKAKGSKHGPDMGGDLSAHEKWLKHMNRRYRMLVEECELNALLRKDFQMSGVNMPTQTRVVKTKDSVQFHVPPPIPKVLPQNQRICIADELPPWTHSAFGTITHLNTLQTQVFEAAFRTSQNMLICAPTGAGKTLVALLVMLRKISEQMSSTGVLDRDFKMIYVAPMKALAQEMVTNFSKRLKGFALVVKEFTGDMQLTKREIAETNLIVTTPEKWDVVTRKQADSDLVQKARLIIIDEIHLLNDDRGPVLEAIVARTLRMQEMDSALRVRLVGLSATLPNYKDVATFLHVDLNEGLKVFGSEYRPVPLEQSFIGAVEPSKADLEAQGKDDKGRPPRWNEEAAIDELSYREVVRSLREGHQVMVFVHSRKQTLSLGQWFADRSQKGKKNEASLFMSEVPGEIMKKASKLQGKDLYGLFQSGICCHHAGMVRWDRSLVEDLFRDGHFKVLICTATLAWGVNLPAHTVIIRGTQIYDPKRGGFTALSVLDVMQIFGRAGRPQYDTSGHGIIVSSVTHIQRYLRLIAQALPIESQFQNKLPDHLNAEIHAGTVTSIAEGVRWLEYTYFWQRIRVNPLAYGLTIADVRKDPKLRAARYDIISKAAVELNDACMVRYTPDTGALDTTDLGRIASHYYVEHISMSTFNEMLRNPDGSFIETLGLGEAMNIVACANEFSQLKARADELDDLNKLNVQLPDTMKKIVKVSGESTDETSIQWKVTTLMKAYISRLYIDSHSLQSDLLYIVQNSGRIARALFEIELQRGHPHTTNTFLLLCKCIDRRSWPFNHPIRQFDYEFFTDSVLQNLETKRPSMATLRDMTSKEVGDLVRNVRLGAVVESLVKHFPSVEVTAEVQPITRSILRVKATITPDFVWNEKYHTGTELFWLFVEDQNNNFIFHHEQLLLKKKDVQQQQPVVVNLTIPVVPEYDVYCVRVYSDRWIGAEDEFVFSIAHLHLPDEAPPNTKLLPMIPLSREVLPEEFHPIYPYPQFNPIQTQVFHTMFHTDSNVLLGAPTGSGKTVCAEMAMLRVFMQNNGGKVVYVAPLKALVKERLKDWGERFDKKLGRKVVELSGDVTPDITALSKAEILCTTPEKWDGISRNWQVRSYVTSVRLVIFDEIHMLGGDRGPIIEVIVSRMRYIGWHKGTPIRLLGLSTAVANPGDLGAWLGVDKRWALYNFEPSVRPVPMRCHIAGYPGRHYCPRMATMNKPTYNAIVEKSPTKPVIVFVSSRRQTRLTAMALINFLMLENNTAKFVRMSVEEIQHMLELIQDPHLKHCAQFGIGIHHAGLCEGDKAVMEDSFRSGKIQILVATSTLAWGVNFPAHLVIIKGTEYYDGKTKSYIDYPLTDVLQMIGRAGRPQFDTEGIAQVLCHEPKKNFYRKFLYDPFPVESALHKTLHAHINAEIVSGTIATRQDAVDYLTWTYLFRRLVKNPSYYGVEDSSPKALTLFLSNLVRKVLYDLETAKCIEPPDASEEGDPNALQFTVLGRLCSYYYLSHITAQHFDSRIDADFDHVALLRIMCEAQEFSELPVRHNEDKLNIELAGRVPLSVDTRNADSPHLKALLLFQAHFHRAKLPISDYYTDQKSAMDNSVRVIQAMVDITANNGHLFVALRCMNLLQCIVQGRWWHSNTILQLPHIEEPMLRHFARLGLHHVAQLANLTLKSNTAVQNMLMNNAEQFGFTEEHVDEIMDAIRRLPLVDVHLSLLRGDKSKVRATDGDAEGSTNDDIAPEDSETYTLVVDLTRLSMPSKFVVAPKFAKQKDEQYWVAIGHEPSGELVALKRINRLRKKTQVRLVFDWDEDWLPTTRADAPATETTLQVYIVCDSYLGLDQQYGFKVPRPT